MNKTKRVRFTELVTFSGNTNTKTASLSNLVSNKHVLSSTGVKPSTNASRSQPLGNTKKDKIQRPSSSNQKNKVEAHPRIVKSSLKNTNHTVEPKGTASVQHSKLKANSELICVKCNGCMLSDNHDLCVLNDVNARAKSKSVKKNSKRKVWKPIGKVFIIIGYTWRPTGQTFTIVGNAFLITKITTTTEDPQFPMFHLLLLMNAGCPNYSLVFRLSCSKHMTGDSSQLTNFVNKFLGLGHNLFPVGQLCDSKLKVAFHQHTFFIRNLKGVDLLIGSQGNNVYTLSLGDMMTSSPTCLLSKASKTRSWLWHRRLSHLNFCTINHLARHGLVRGLPKLKFEKNHLCSACAIGKSKKKPHKPKSKDTNQEKLYILHMDLCGPMRVASVNGNKYILVIIDNYSRFTWVKFLRSKDEAPDFIIKFLKMIKVRLKVPVRRIKTDNGTEFVNQTLREYYEKVDISHETSVARSSQQNGVVERRNRTLIEAARTMLIYAKASLFLWAEAVTTKCYTQNRSIVRLHHDKTPYELLHDKLPDLSFFHVFGDSAIQLMIVRTWDILFQLMFDELLAPPPCVDHPAHEVIASISEVVAPEPVASTDSHSSTTVDQDAPSPSNSQTTPKTQSPIIPNDVEEDNHDLDVAHMNNDPFFGIPILEEEVYVSQPDEFVDTDNPNHVYKLKKALYGLKQAPRAWYDMLSSFLISQDFSKGSVDPTLFIHREGKELLLARPTEKHLHAVKRIFRYLRGTVNQGLWYLKDYSIALIAFADTDHAGCQDTHRSTYGSMQFLGDRLVSWSKHIDIRYHFIKEQVENGVMELYFVNMEYQLIDIFTKALGRERFEFLINKLGMRSFTPETLKQLADEVEE
nr:hypothetical protein [Tanacetum cinerariifolium]